MKAFFDFLSKLLKIVLLIFLSAMVIDIILQIIARKILLISIPWTEELARYIMVWTAFLGLGVAYRLKELHIINILTEKLSANKAKQLSLISDILIAIFVLFIIPYGIKVCSINMSAMTPALRIPQGYVLAAVPIGCIITLSFVFESIWNYFKSK